MIEALEAASGRPVSRETIDRLSLYLRLLCAENRRQNLVSAATLEDAWERHILDSAQLTRFEPHAGASWVDVGSGAGLPGIVVACLTEGPIMLVEPRRLRAEFLARVRDELGLAGRVEITAGKAESVMRTFEVVTARAVAPLPRLLELCTHLSTGKTLWLLPKGRSARAELAEARQSWQGMFHVKPSITDPESSIIVAQAVRPRP